MRIMPAEKLAEFGTFSGKFHVIIIRNSGIEPIINVEKKNSI